MTIDWITAAWFLPFVVPITIWVSWSDMATMKIPNKAVLALMAVFVVIGLFALEFTEYLWRYLHWLVIFALGFVAASIGMMGAGDAKYAAAMAPFVALSDVSVFLILLAGTIIAAFVLHRLARRTPAIRNRFPDWVSWTDRAFPMGFALAPALMFYLLIGLFGS